MRRCANERCSAPIVGRKDSALYCSERCSRACHVRRRFARSPWRRPRKPGPPRKEPPPCVICGKATEYRRGAPRKTCSEECRTLHRIEVDRARHARRYEGGPGRNWRAEKQCVMCGEPFVGTALQLTCSPKCRLARARQVAREKWARMTDDERTLAKAQHRLWKLGNPEKVARYRARSRKRDREMQRLAEIGRMVERFNAATEEAS